MMRYAHPINLVLAKLYGVEIFADILILYKL